MLGGHHRRGSPGDDDIDFAADEFGRELGGTLVASVRPAILDCNVATVYPAKLTQPLLECREPLRTHRKGRRAEVADGGQLRLLRARRERPRGCRAAEQCDELAAPDVRHGSSSPRSDHHGRFDEPATGRTGRSLGQT